LLLRLLTEPNYDLGPSDLLDVEGDIEALNPLAASLAAGTNMIGVRCEETRK
jgi:hypothetical protein